jgi:5'-nucleotidase
MNKRLRALVTNDDGIASEGLRYLAMAAVAADLEVVIAAPLEESSGSSAALSAVQADGRVLIERRKLADLDDTPTYAVRALPGFIALLATRGAFGPAPGIVLSGVNKGANTGHAVLHSGTVGAAVTGRTYGTRAMAVSLGLDPASDTTATLHWATAAHLARLAIPHVVDSSEEFVFNLNVPNVPADRLRGVRAASLAPFGAVQTNVTEVGEGYVQLTVADIDPSGEPDTDAAALAAGYATVTLLNPLCERTTDGLSETFATALGNSPASTLTPADSAESGPRA